MPIELCTNCDIRHPVLFKTLDNRDCIAALGRELVNANSRITELELWRDNLSNFVTGTLRLEVEKRNRESDK